VLILLFIGVLLTRRVITWLRDPDKKLLPVVIFSLQLVGALLFVSLSVATIFNRFTGVLDPVEVQATWIPFKSLEGFWHYLMGMIEPIPWLNNWPALTIPFMGSIFSIFMLRQFFAQIPDDLFDAAQIDGAGHWKFLWSVALPLSTAPILVITVLSFIGTWNALAWPLLVTNTPDWRPIAVGLYNFVDDEAGSEINLQMAGAVITIIPILILYFITQRQFTESIARTGLKG
jgi:ABC-type sugar transport system permease subunit